MVYGKTRRFYALVGILLIFSACALFLASPTQPHKSQRDTPAPSIHAAQNASQMKMDVAFKRPLSFEANEGQTSDEVKFEETLLTEEEMGAA